MAKRGEIARQAVYNKIAETFGGDFLGVNDKKIYVQVKEGAENIAFAIAVTMPKAVPCFAETVPSGADTPPWEAQSGLSAKPATAISEEDEKKIQEMMGKLGF